MRKDSRAMLKSLMVVALPIMLQNLISNSIAFLDTLMVGQLGEIEIAATGVANQVSFFISLFFFGIASGTSIFLSQYYGAKDFSKMKKTMAFAITIALTGSVLMALFSFIRPDLIMILFTKEGSVEDVGCTYLKIVAFSYIFSAISACLSAGFRSISRAEIPLLITLSSLSINALGNYLLIFGIGPFPTLGVAGAAIATLIARLVEMLLMIVFTWYKDKKPFAFSLKSDLTFDREFIKLYIVTALPVLINETMWSLGMVAYRIAESKLGTAALATTNISENIGNFFFIALIGIGNGTTVLIGNTLGSGERERAHRWARKILLLAFLIGILMALLQFLMAPLFASLFNVSSDITALAIACLRLTSLILPLRSLNMIIIVGLMRSGGDTRYAAITELSCVWLIGVPVAFLGALVLHLPLPQLCLLIGLEELCKLLIGLPRIKSGRWANVLTENNT